MPEVSEAAELLQDLRAAVEPVAHWFCLDEEDYDLGSLIPIVGEISKMLADDRECNLRLMKAFRRVARQYGDLELAPEESVEYFGPETVSGLLAEVCELEKAQLKNGLLPCPFCGGEPRIERDFNRDGFSVQCQKCFAIFSASQPQRAVIGWNNRRTTGLVNWLEGEMSKYRENKARDSRPSAADDQFSVMQRFRKMIRRLLRQ